MDKFVHERNLKHYRELLSGATHEAQRLQILKLLAEEEAKDRFRFIGELSVANGT